MPYEKKLCNHMQILEELKLREHKTLPICLFYFTFGIIVLLSSE